MSWNSAHSASVESSFFVLHFGNVQWLNSAGTATTAPQGAGIPVILVKLSGDCRVDYKPEHFRHGRCLFGLLGHAGPDCST
jgi:hypothetical protein